MDLYIEGDVYQNHCYLQVKHSNNCFVNTMSAASMVDIPSNSIV